jgi:hypothetical protein
MEKSRQDNASQAIDGNAHGPVYKIIAEALAPDVIAVGIELRQENVSASR